MYARINGGYSVKAGDRVKTTGGALYLGHWIEPGTLGEVLDVTAEGYLRVKLDSGEEHILAPAEVTLDKRQK